MRTQVSGRQIDIGQSLQSHVTDEIGTLLGKYAQRPTDAAAVFSKSGHEFVCESEVHLSTGMTVQAKGRADEIYAAFDACAEKMDKQLRRYKRRLKDHGRGRERPIEAAQAASYVLAAPEEEPETIEPVIVAETTARIAILSVGEAVMQMELSGAPVLVFRKEEGGAPNVVYVREDGNVGWIDPA